ncbi:hypothetical protein MA16_Dca024554 [Dendrobium catenatum]|uniref:Uncharacterized protein n=1 Tax=Dendrobium catenatum TaxID=906689 RepID=A0A2I0WE42_9ASPA|nr:hypothetical protein MA16_Dca024554 [Dendrobium catenatum]
MEWNLRREEEVRSQDEIEKRREEKRRRGWNKLSSFSKEKPSLRFGEIKGQKTAKILQQNCTETGSQVTEIPTQQPRETSQQGTRKASTGGKGARHGKPTSKGPKKTKGEEKRLWAPKIRPRPLLAIFFLFGEGFLTE